MASNVNGGEATEDNFLSNILKPGSSLNPKFLAILDGAFVGLFLVLLALAFLTSGSLHMFILMAIELCLWASVKWFVNELKNTPIVTKEQDGEVESKKNS